MELIQVPLKATEILPSLVMGSGWGDWEEALSAQWYSTNKIKFPKTCEENKVWYSYIFFCIDMLRHGGKRKGFWLLLFLNWMIVTFPYPQSSSMHFIYPILRFFFSFYFFFQLDAQNLLVVYFRPRDFCRADNAPCSTMGTALAVGFWLTPAPPARPSVTASPWAGWDFCARPPLWGLF